MNSEVSVPAQLRIRFRLDHSITGVLAELVHVVTAKGFFGTKFCSALYSEESLWLVEQERGLL